MNQFHYDGQIRRFVIQFIRMFSNFQVEFGKDRYGVKALQTVPIYYGAPSRQASVILKKNSENTLNAVPAMAVYISALNYDRDRIQNPYFEGKLNIREQQFNPNTSTTTGVQDGLYTIERLMPAPYKLTLKLDIWTTNTDQKHQLIEQINPLFNPGIEIQNTDNYIDWSSLSVVYLTDTIYSSRTVPMGGEDPIDITTLSFELPIWLTLPAKVKKMGVITQIIANVFNKDGEIDAEQIFRGERPLANVRITALDYNVLLNNNVLTLLAPDDVTIRDRVIGKIAHWDDYASQFGQITNGVSQVKLEFEHADGFHEITGTVAYDISDPSKLSFTPFLSTLPANTLPPVNAIIDPFKVSTTNSSIPIISPPIGTSYLIINPIGTADGNDPIAWAGSEGTNLIANANDIITWTGSYWIVTFDSTNNQVQYVTNLNTTVQYSWTGTDWVKSIDGIYRVGEWSLVL